METKQDLQARTEVMIVSQNNLSAQTVIDLCPQFLKQELKISNYDNSMNLRDEPVFLNSARKLPDTPNKEAQMDLIRASIVRIEETLKPATTQQRQEVLGRLALHKGVGNYTEGQATALISDYIRLLSDCPYDLLNKACDDCILDPEIQYFPQVGRIRNKMANEMRMRQLFLGRLRKIIELSSHQELREEKPNAAHLAMQLAERFKPK